MSDTIWTRSSIGFRLTSLTDIRFNMSFESEICCVFQPQIEKAPAIAGTTTGLTGCLLANLADIRAIELERLIRVGIGHSKSHLRMTNLAYSHTPVS